MARLRRQITASRTRMRPEYQRPRVKRTRSKSKSAIWPKERLDAPAQEHLRCGNVDARPLAETASKSTVVVVQDLDPVPVILVGALALDVAETCEGVGLPSLDGLGPLGLG